MIFPSSCMGDPFVNKFGSSQAPPRFCVADVATIMKRVIPPRVALCYNLFLNIRIIMPYNFCWGLKRPRASVWSLQGWGGRGEGVWAGLGWVDLFVRAHRGGTASLAAACSCYT